VPRRRHPLRQGPFGLAPSRAPGRALHSHLLWECAYRTRRRRLRQLAKQQQVVSGDVLQLYEFGRGRHDLGPFSCLASANEASFQSSYKLQATLLKAKSFPGLYVLGFVEGGLAQLRTADCVETIAIGDLTAWTFAAAAPKRKRPKLFTSGRCRCRCVGDNRAPKTTSSCRSRSYGTVRASGRGAVRLEKSPARVARMFRSRRGRLAARRLSRVYVTACAPNRGGLDEHVRKPAPGDRLLAVDATVLPKGDLLLRLCRTPKLLGLHRVRLLKSASADSSVTLRLMDGPEFLVGLGRSGSNFQPSWSYWLALPRWLSVERDVELSRHPATGSLGFSIVGRRRNSPASRRRQPRPVRTRWR
uniref:Peptidase A1 domain-containing protein n=1 Tax=Macrostomum lignano TaxID=282301 RepID=A0A1I8FQW2_9PLAT